MKWELTIKHRWKSTKFRFKKITDAEAFLKAFMEAKQPDEDEDDRKHKWEYKITPILKEEEEDSDE